MKKIVLLIVINSIGLFANLLEVEHLYERGEYAQAIAQAKASPSEYSNPKLHLLWAKSAEKLGKINDAMSAYERVIILDENNIEAKLLVGKIYKKTGRVTLMKSVRKELINYQLTPAQRNTLDLLQESDYGSIKAKASIVGGYDSNINSSAFTGKLVSALFTRVNGSLSYIHDLEEKGGWYARGDLVLSYQDNRDAKLYNLFYGSIGTGIGYKKDKYNMYLPLSYSKIYYLEKDLLSQIKMEPSISIAINKKWISNIKTSFVQEAYTQLADSNRDDIRVGVEAALYYLTNSDYMYIKANMETTGATRVTDAKFVNKNTFLVSAGLNYNFNSFLTLRADYRYRYALYQTLVTGFNMQRYDYFNQFDFKFSYFYKKTIELYVENQFTVNTSNYVPARYSKNIAMFGIDFNY